MPPEKCALVSVALGPVYVKVPLASVYTRLPSPPPLATVNTSLALAVVNNLLVGLSLFSNISSRVNSAKSRLIVRESTLGSPSSSEYNVWMPVPPTRSAFTLSSTRSSV